MKNTQCGDWHLGWCHSGYNHVGVLRINPDKTFKWTGSSQGRHGQKGNLGAYLEFKLKNGKDILLPESFEIIDKKGTHPVWSEIINSVKRLRNSSLNE